MLEDYLEMLEDLINRRDLYYAGGWDWDNYTSEIEDLLAEAQDMLYPEVFDILQDYLLKNS